MGTVGMSGPEITNDCVGEVGVFVTFWNFRTTEFVEKAMVSPGAMVGRPEVTMIMVSGVLNLHRAREPNSVTLLESKNAEQPEEDAGFAGLSN